MDYDINIKHLEYFMKVAKLGSINKAAQALFISQPHLGKIIHEMEEKFGVLLFKRSNQGVALTPEGEEFLKHASNILKEMDCLQFQSLRSEGNFEHLSVSMTKFSHVMESFIDTVLHHQDQPAFTHQLYEGTPRDVVEDVFSGRADVGVLHFDSKRRKEVEEMLTTKGLSYRFLAYVKPHIVISKNHPLVVSHQTVNLHTLANYGYISYLGQYDDLVYNLFGSEPGNLRRGPAKVIYLSSRTTLMQLISMSDFYSIGIHNFGLQNSRYQAISIPLSDSDLMFEFGYVMLEGMPVSDITKEFIDGVKMRLA